MNSMSATKTISLSIGERIRMLVILNAFKGNLDKLAIILEDIKQLPVIDEEWKKAERVVVGDQWNWDEEKGGMKEITFQKDTIDYVLQEIKEKSDKNELGIGDKPLIDLRKKLMEASI